jgi:hypothetical protein
MVARIFILYLILFAFQGIAQDNPWKYIIRIEVISKRSPEVLVQTGFKLKGQKYIITSLHGITKKIGVNTDDVKIMAVFHDGTELKLKIKSVNIPEDIAVLYNDSIKFKLKDKEGLLLGDPEKLINNQKLNINGYSRGMNPNDSKITVASDKGVRLEYKISADEYSTYKDRESPSINTTILSLNGKMLKGQSGAPVLTKGNKVVGMMGEQVPGTDYCWAIILTKDKVDSLFSRSNMLKYPKYVFDTLFLETNIDWLTQEKLDSLVLDNKEDSLRIVKIKKEQSDILRYDHISKFNSGKPSLLSVAYRNNFVMEKSSVHSLSTSFYLPSFTALLTLPFAGYKITAGVDLPLSYQTTSTNNYETLTHSTGTIEANYKTRILRPFVHISCFSNLVKHKLNPYIGFSYNYIRQSPVQSTWQYNGSVFEGTRQSFTYWIPEEIIGIRYTAKWYAIELEGSFKNFKMKNENFRFDYFGNAVPIIQTSVIKYYTISLNVLINCSFIKIYIPKTTRYYTKYEF